MLGRTAASLTARAPVEEVLDELRRSFGLGGLVLRRADERLIAAAPASQAELPPPSTELEPATLAAASTRVHTLGRTGFRFPEGGGRLPLAVREPLVLDLWEGNTEGLTLDERRALAVAAHMIALAGADLARLAPRARGGALPPSPRLRSSLRVLDRPGPLSSAP